MPGLLDGAGRANHWGILRDVAVEVKPVALGGKLAMLTRGAQSERLRKRRQSGMVDLDGSLGRSCISNVGEDVG